MMLKSAVIIVICAVWARISWVSIIMMETFDRHIISAKIHISNVNNPNTNNTTSNQQTKFIFLCSYCYDIPSQHPTFVISPYSYSSHTIIYSIMSFVNVLLEGSTDTRRLSQNAFFFVSHSDANKLYAIGMP